MSDGYLSKDRQHLARLQRERRKDLTRIDYMPGKEARALILAAQASKRPGSLAATNSAVLDAIVTGWAELSGIKKPEVVTSMTPINRPELSDTKRARAYDFGKELPGQAEPSLVAGRRREAAQRIACGAARHRDGQPCRAMSEPGRRRCRFHGGCSTGPKTPEGKARALANLRRGSK